VESIYLRKAAEMVLPSIVAAAMREAFGERPSLLALFVNGRPPKRKQASTQSKRFAKSGGGRLCGLAEICYVWRPSHPPLRPSRPLRELPSVSRIHAEKKPRMDTNEHEYGGFDSVCGGKQEPPFGAVAERTQNPRADRSSLVLIRVYSWLNCIVLA